MFQVYYGFQEKQFHTLPATYRVNSLKTSFYRLSDNL